MQPFESSVSLERNIVADETLPDGPLNPVKPGQQCKRRQQSWCLVKCKRARPSSLYCLTYSRRLGPKAGCWVLAQVQVGQLGNPAPWQLQSMRRPVVEGMSSTSNQTANTGWLASRPLTFVSTPDSTAQSAVPCLASMAVQWQAYEMTLQHGSESEPVPPLEKPEKVATVPLHLAPHLTADVWVRRRERNPRLLSPICG